MQDVLRQIVKYKICWFDEGFYQVYDEDFDQTNTSITNPNLTKCY